jgi:hypothetical protein
LFCSFLGLRLFGLPDDFWAGLVEPEGLRPPEALKRFGSKTGASPNPKSCVTDLALFQKAFQFFRHISDPAH